MKDIFIIKQQLIEALYFRLLWEKSINPSFKAAANAAKFDDDKKATVKIDQGGPNDGNTTLRCFCKSSSFAWMIHIKNRASRILKVDVVHSSEIRGLRSTKCSSETLQNLLYSMYKKSHVVFFVFHFVQLYFFPYECPGLCRHRPGHS